MDDRCTDTSSFVSNSTPGLPFDTVPLNDLAFDRELVCGSYNKFHTGLHFKPEVSPSSLLARFPAGEMTIFTIQAAEINRRGSKREPGSGQQEAFNWVTSRQGELRYSLAK